MHLKITIFIKIVFVYRSVIQYSYLLLNIHICNISNEKNYYEKCIALDGIINNV